MTTRPRVSRLPRVPPAAVLRAFLLAALAIAACGWAIARTIARRSHRAEIPAVAPAPSSSEEQPAPDLVPIE